MYWIGNLFKWVSTGKWPELNALDNDKDVIPETPNVKSCIWNNRKFYVKLWFENLYILHSNNKIRCH